MRINQPNNYYHQVNCSQKSSLLVLLRNEEFETEKFLTEEFEIEEVENQPEEVTSVISKKRKTQRQD